MGPRAALTLSGDSADSWRGGDGELAPGETLLVWCDGKVDFEGFAPFAVAASEQHLTLSVDGVVTDRVWAGEVP